MQELISYFQGINSFHWGSNWYQWFFYVGTLLIICLEKDKIAKTVFGLYPAIFLLLIFNPLFNYAIHFVFFYPNAYYARMFSFIPLFFCIAFGIMQLITRIKREWIKPLAICAVSVLIIIGGNDYYKAPWMAKAMNAEKVPVGVSEIVEILNKEDRIINVALPDPINVYIRQIDADIVTPYGRYMNELGTSLSQETPDVSYVMKEAGKQAVDYVVVHNKYESKEHFKISGYEPYAETEHYLIYKVSNVPHIKKVYNEKRQVISITSYDKDDNPVENDQGYATVVYEYDDDGFQIKETYLDKNGQKVLKNGTYASIQKKYYKFSKLLSSLRYLDKNEEPILASGRYETRYDYSRAEKRLVRESYFDQNGLPMNRTDALYAARTILYDSNGRIIGENYFDVEGNATIIYSGYASYFKELDKNNNVVKEIYYGTDGRPIQIKAGYAGISRTFTESGVLTSETYLDENGKAQMCISGYCKVAYSYDQNRIREDYYDDQNNRIILPCGYSAYERELNHEGQTISETYYGLEDEVLGWTNQTGNSSNDMLRFFHCSDGVCVKSDNQIEMISTFPDNSFGAVYFVLYDALANNYLLFFGVGEDTGNVSGEYVHNLPNGLYNLRLKVNGSLSDEWVQSLVYFREGDVVNYTYSLNMLEKDHIIIKDLIVRKREEY